MCLSVRAPAGVCSKGGIYLPVEVYELAKNV